MTGQSDVAERLRREVAGRLAQLRREKSAREKRDIGQQELAAVIGATPETYSRYENGKRKVPEEAVVALAAYYGVKPEFVRYGVRDTLTIAGLEIDIASIRPASAQELEEWKRLAAQAEARAAALPPTRRVGNSRRRKD